MLQSFLLLAACSGDDSVVDTFVNDYDRGTYTMENAIFFNVDGFNRGTTDKVSTRAVGREDLTRLRQDGFAVFACRTGQHPYVSSTISWNFMWNQKVTYSTNGWSYAPIKYWPNEAGGEQRDEYITFFAYAPYSKGDESDKASLCIVDYSNATEIGDPWLVYQLGGSENDWQDHQVDLLYAFAKDQQRPDKTGAKVKLSFRHALAGAGDQVKVVCSDMLKSKLSQLAASLSENVTMTLEKVRLDYTLTRKGRLVLNNASEPNWQAVASEDPMVHRILEINSNHVMARASDSSCSTYEYSKSDLGVFYIPMNPVGHTQQVEVTLSYSLSNGYSGTVGGVIKLAANGGYSQNQDFVLTISGATPLQ